MIKRFVKHTLIFLCAVFFIVYFYIQVKNIFVEKTETEYATRTSIDEVVEMKCYIVRNETIVNSEYLGTYNYVISEGEKLSLGQTIANVYSTDSEYRAQEEIQEINSKIAILEDSSVENNYFTMNIAKIDRSINETLIKFRQEVLSGDYSLAVKNKNELLVTLNKRYLVVNSLTGFDDMIEVYSKKKNSLTDSVSSKKESVTANKSGYFFSDVDGYEDKLTVDLLDDITVEEFLNAVQLDTERADNSVVGKIVSDFEWYTVCLVDNQTALKFNSNSYYNISYPYSVGTDISSKLIKKVTQPGYDKSLLIFESNKNLDGFNFMREQVVEVTLNTYDGLKIKKEALRIVDSNEGVYVLDGNTVVFKRAKKLYENDGYYVISEIDPAPDESKVPYLKMYDAVINNGKELYDGKVID